MDAAPLTFAEIMLVETLSSKYDVPHSEWQADQHLQTYETIVYSTWLDKSATHTLFSALGSESTAVMNDWLVFEAVPPPCVESVAASDMARIRYCLTAREETSFLR